MINEFKYLHSIHVEDKTDLNLFARGSLHSFCNNYSLDQSRHLLWQLLKDGLANEESILSSKERLDLFSFYESVNELLFAVSIIYADHKI